MKLLFNLLILVFVAGIGAQRARTSAGDPSPSETATRKSRGRVRFVVPSDISESDLADAAAPIERPKETVRKPDRKIPRPSSNKPYEVKEVLDDIPNVNARKIHKPRVITETRFEAANAPKKPLYVPLPLPEDEVLPEDLLANFGSQSTEKLVDVSPKETTAATASQSTSDVSTEQILPITTNLGQSSELTTPNEQVSSTENEIKKLDATTQEIKKKQPENLQIVTPVSDLRKTTRVQTRPRTTATSTEETSTPKFRTRSRPARRQNSESVEVLPSTAVNTRTRVRVRPEAKLPEDVAAPIKSGRPRPVRRRLDSAEVAEASVRGRVPSLYSSENGQDGPIKSRTGRKVNYPTVTENDNVQISDRRSSLRRRPAHLKDRSSNSIETTTKDETNQVREYNRSSRRGASRNGNRSNRGRTTESSYSSEEALPSSPGRRSSIGRGRKVEKIAEGIEKQFDNSNKNEVIKPKTFRGRIHNTERLENRPESAELRSRNKPKAADEDPVTISTTTPEPTTRSRRVDHQSRSKPEVQSESKLEESILSTTQNIATGESRRNVRNRIDTRRNKSSEDVVQSPETATSRTDNRRRSHSRKSNTVEAPIRETTTESRDAPRNRPRVRNIPPIIDEQILEVLPLFESEVKTVVPIKKRLHSSRESANQIKISTSNEIQADSPRTRVETKTEKSEKIEIRTSKPLIKESVETKVSEVVTKRKLGRQVVRKVKINKPEPGNVNKINDKSVETTEKTVTTVTPSRGHARAEIKKDKGKSLLSSSEEDVGDSDNYPEPFKALIQAKIAKQSKSKGSRSQKAPSDDSSTKISTDRIVTSSRIVPVASTTTARITTTTASAPLTTSLKINDDDNELVPNSVTTVGIVRPTRRRFSLSTKVPESEEVTSRYTKRPSYFVRKSTRSTVSPSQVSVVTEVSTTAKKQSRYHARFSAGKNDERAFAKNLETSSEKDVEVKPTHKSRSFSPKPPRGLYSLNRNGTKSRIGKLDSPASTQQVVSGTQKAGRYSSKYRKDIFNRSGSTRPTPAPAYTPTVPTVTTPSVKAGVEDVISGMEVISIDDPINTIPSDSLINGELLSNPNPFNNPSSSKLVPASLVTKEGRSTVAPVPIVSTEKPVSIIERIIYSITAISTASPDKTIDITNDGPTKPTAIFKIPSKTQKEDVTIDTLAGQHGLETVTLNEIKPLTTETPTTIIERILSSISAIQASSTTTERTDTQVGNSLNTISTTFKPLSSNKRVSATVSTTLSTTTLSPSSTPQDALDVIEQISSERSLQQRTISRLLELLKSISPNATPVPEKVVVVTPKITSFTSATSVGDLNREVEVFNTTSSSVESRIAATTVADLPLETLAPTTPDLLQNTIAGIESTTNLPTSSGNTKLPDTISISDFLATLDTLNGVESTTGNQRIIESTTPTSLTNESTTVSANSAATTAADKAELIAVTTVTPTTVESANLVTVVTEAATPTTELVTTTLGTAQFENLETLDGATEGGGDNTTPPVTLAARIELGTESVVTSTSPEESTESQPPVITTEMPSTTATSAQQEITTPLPSESSNTIPPGADPSSILNMLSRLLEISGRTQVLNTITLEQTTISSSTDSSTLTDGTSTSAPISTTANFAVSPGSVTIFSANDLNSMFTPTDDGTTVTILSRSFLTTSPPTSTESSFTETNAITPSSSPDNSSAAIVTMGPADKSADLISTTPLSAPTSNDTADTITTTIPPDESADLVVSTLAPTENSDAVMTTTIMENLTGNIDSTTQIPMTETSTESMLPTTTITAEVTTIIESSSSNNTMDVSNATNSTMQGSANTTVSDRAGRLLIIESEPVQNDLQVSSEPPEKDYFIFGILSNNTILRKRPSKYPNKRTPFVIVGVYPNNTVIQKFPNGTLIPEEPVIQVSGFDTRENPPTLTEITSNQVTQDSSPLDDNKILQTGDIRSNPPSNDASQPITTIAPAVVTFSAPPTVTMSTLTATTSGNAAMARETVTPKVGDRNRDVEEVNIEENTISNNKPEKIVEQTTTIRGPQRSRQRTTTPRGVTTTQTAKPAVTELPTTQEPTTILAAIRIEDLVEDETTLPSIMETTIAPKLSNRFRTTTSPPELTTRRAFTTPRYTNTITTVVPSFENLQLTIRPTTPYLIQRIIGNITGTAVRLGGEPTTNIPLSTTTTSTEIPIETSTIPPTIRSRVRIPTTTIPQALTTPIPTMTTELLTTTDAALTATSRSRGRSRYSLSTPFEALVRTVTVTPSTVSTDAPSTTDFPFRTTFTPRRYTQTPTTINIPSRIAMFTPTTVFANVPTATEQNFMSTTSFNSQNADLEGSTVFPVFTTTFEEVTETQPPPPPSAPDTTTSTPPTFASTQRQRQRTTTPLTAMTSTNLQRLAELRLSENFGELSTTGDYFTPTTVVPTITSTTAASSLQTTLKTITTKVKQLTEQQKKDLEELAKLEQEQQQILQQLAFLTRLNLGGGGPKPTRSPSNLAGRVVDFAAERNKQASTENPSAANLLETLTNQNSKPLETKPLSLEDILKQLNVNPNSVTLSPSSSSYGQSTDAILAALLKQQGIEPNTPKALGDQLKTTTAVPRTTTTRRAPATRRRTTTTTPRPGPIMQGLNWLLNALAPAPTTKKPATRKKAPASSTSSSRNQPFRQEIELLSSQPTEYTPVVYTVPPRTRSTPSQSRQSSRFRKPLHSLSETELRNLVIQLETAQRDPSKAKDIDFASLGFQESTEKATTLLADNAVQITNSGRVGSNSKIRQTPDSSATEAGVVPLVYRRGRYTTPVSSGVSNSILDDEEEEPTTTRSRKVSLPPVQLNPIPGIDGEGGTQVRGQLINAAVNVTRAISQFLGSAIQGAAQSFQSFIGSGSRQVGNYFSTSSISSNNRPG